MPPKPNIPACQPGVIFCLRHRAEDLAAKLSGSVAASSPRNQINPLSPHYLVYVHDDGTVRFSFAQPKESLLLLRDLAAGEATAFEQLCDQFDARTNDGQDMTHYSGLIAKATASIAAGFRKRIAAGLQSGRGFVIPDQSQHSDRNQRL